MKLKAQTPQFKPMVTLSHGQTIKQNVNYQSMECHYSMTIQVEDTPEAVAAGRSRLEREVERMLVSKAKAQKALLDKIGGAA